jgi:DNA repair protein RadD
LVLDFAGNIVEHGPIDAIRPPKKPGERVTSGAPVRECPECQAILPVQLRECPECGHTFPAPERALHDATASVAPILSSELQTPVRHAVTGVYYARHVGKSGVPTLQVTYTCGLRSFCEWVCLEHGGMARSRAAAWWYRRTAASAAPRSVGDALELSARLAKPTAINVLEKKPYPEIVSHEFADDAQRTAAIAQRVA